MATRGLLLKTSILHEISKNKHSFERLIAAAIILKKTVGKNCSSGFLRSFYLTNLKTKHYSFSSFFLLGQSQNEALIGGLFAWNCGLH